MNKKAKAKLKGLGEQECLLPIYISNIFQITEVYFGNFKKFEEPQQKQYIYLIDLEC
jgi:hypothetical protein